jgi:hypothetical protein
LLFNRGTFHYLGDKSDPVKNTFSFLAIVALMISFNSCTDVEGSDINKPVVEKKEKKEKKSTVLVKTKKREKKKNATVLPKTDNTIIESKSAKKASNTTTEAQSTKTTEAPSAVKNAELMNIAFRANAFAAKNAYSTKYCFLIDMSIASGSNRFFVFDMEKNSIILSGLVAHGSCNETFLSRPRFSNQPKCGCSSLGKYKVGEFYHGKYGKSYRLYGLDNTNDNAYKRAVVIHAYDCVPDKEIYPMVLCNSEGCAMVSYNFFDKLSRIINSSDKPILLWVYQ